MSDNGRTEQEFDRRLADGLDREAVGPLGFRHTKGPDAHGALPGETADGASRKRW